MLGFLGVCIYCKIFSVKTGDKIKPIISIYLGCDQTFTYLQSVNAVSGFINKLWAPFQIELLL